MHLDKLWLTNFRNYESAELSFPDKGLIVVSGANGQGKTNLLEAIYYTATQRSFRASQLDALIKAGFDSAVVRAEALREERSLLIESQLQLTGRNQMQINRQPFNRARDARETLLATVFSPDDLELVKGGPSQRRDFVDALMADGKPRLAQLQSDVDRVLRQRNTLLRQAGGRMSPEIESTLDVWDAKLAEAGEALTNERRSLLSALQPKAVNAYRRFVDQRHGEQQISVVLQATWAQEEGGPGLAVALEEARKADVARGITTVGPHRDEILLLINNFPARTHASQGEQRTLALALRIAGHELLTQVTGAPPLLLLDDVFSELDPQRSLLLTQELPMGQVFLATANHIPVDSDIALMLSVDSGKAA